MYTILLLAEDALHQHDVTRIASLHDDEISVHVLVPADAEHNRLIESLDEVALGNLRDALDDDTPTPEQAERDAMHAVNASVALFTAAGVEAKGSITGSNPIPAAVEAVAQYDADEIIVVTPPHLVDRRPASRLGVAAARQGQAAGAARHLRHRPGRQLETRKSHPGHVGAKSRARHNALPTNCRQLAARVIDFEVPQTLADR